jgi:hypothetical protein
MFGACFAPAYPIPYRISYLKLHFFNLMNIIPFHFFNFYYDFGSIRMTMVQNVFYSLSLFQLNEYYFCLLFPVFRESWNVRLGCPHSSTPELIETFFFSLSHYHLCADPGLLFMVLAAIFIIPDYVELSV